MNIYEQAKAESLAHYQRMIDWAKTQPGEYHPSTIRMDNEIGDFWGVDTCAYCGRFECIGLEATRHNLCPLSSNQKCCDDIFHNMAAARSWSEWIKYAKQVQDFIAKSRTKPISRFGMLKLKILYSKSYSRLKSRIKKINTFVRYKILS